MYSWRTIPHQGLGGKRAGGKWWRHGGSSRDFSLGPACLGFSAAGCAPSRRYGRPPQPCDRAQALPVGERDRRGSDGRSPPSRPAAAHARGRHRQLRRPAGRNRPPPSRGQSADRRRAASAEHRGPAVVVAGTPAGPGPRGRARAATAVEALDGARGPGRGARPGGRRRALWEVTSSSHSPRSKGIGRSPVLSGGTNAGRSTTLANRVRPETRGSGVEPPVSPRSRSRRQ